MSADRPTVRVESAYAKNRREAVQPIPPDLTRHLPEYLAGKPKGERVWPGTWHKQASAKMLRIDLEAADIPYETDEGFADFHALRHTYVSLIAQSGASAKEAQTLARHSTVQLTLGSYAHVGFYDLAAAVNGLPSNMPTYAGESTVESRHCTKPQKALGFLRFSGLLT